MQKTLLKKGIAIAVIAVFIGVSFSPVTLGKVEKGDIIRSDMLTDTDEESFVYQTDLYERYLQPKYFSSIWPEINSSPKNINADDIYFTNPYNNDIFRAGDTIYINGTITAPYFKNYVIEYGRGIEPTEWESTGINLVNNGKSPIFDSTAATWNTSHINEPDFYTLRITVYTITVASKERSRYNFFIPLFNLLSVIRKKDDGFNLLSVIRKKDDSLFKKLNPNPKTAFIKNIYLDPSLKNGWPQRVEWHNKGDDHYLWSGPMDPVVSDVDNDGMMEIFVTKQSRPYSIVYGFELNGSFVEGWPIEIKDKWETMIRPTIVDVDNDGYQEIIISSWSGLRFYNYDGSLKKVIDLERSSQPRIEAVFFDLDNDGDMEIIKTFQNRSNQIAVLDLDGNFLEGWPQTYFNFTGPDGNTYFVESTFESCPAVGNFDDDSDMEIVMVSCRNVFDDPENPRETWHIEGRIYVYNIDGSILDGFPVDVDGWIYRAPAVGDVNNDGYDEIVIGSAFLRYPGGFNFGLFVIDRFGGFCDGWPQLTELFGVSNDPVLADFDGDGFLEIIAGKYDLDVFKTDFDNYVFNYKGEILSGWPQQTTWFSPGSPTVGDVNGDGVPDIIVAAGSGVYPGLEGDGGVYAWNLDGSLIDGFPKITDIDAQVTITIADIDNDGVVELVGSSSWDIDLVTMEYKHRSSIYVWELDYVFDDETLEWPMFHHDHQYSGWYHND